MEHIMDHFYSRAAFCYLTSLHTELLATFLKHSKLIKCNFVQMCNSEYL